MMLSRSSRHPLNFGNLPASRRFSGSTAAVRKAGRVGRRWPATFAPGGAQCSLRGSLEKKRRGAGFRLRRQVDGGSFAGAGSPAPSRVPRETTCLAGWTEHFIYACHPQPVNGYPSLPGPGRRGQLLLQALPPPDGTPHTLTIPSISLVSSRDPSGLNDTDMRPLLCPLRMSSSAPVLGSHSRAVRSVLRVTTRVPSGLNDPAKT